LAATLSFSLFACDFDTKNYQELPGGEEYKTVQDVQNGMTGAYNALGSYEFLGDYAVAFGDFFAGISDGSPSTGHMYSMSTLTIEDTNAEMTDCWYYGFKVIDRCTRTIAGAKKVMANKEALHLTDEDEANLASYMGQCYALKALANYYLVNLFAYPYKSGTENLGLPLVKDEPIPPFTKVDRATVGETYAQINSNIKLAEDYLEQAAQQGVKLSAFYMGQMGLQALKARVCMDMEKYDDAATAAKQAIKLKNAGDGTGSDNKPSDDNYQTMWRSLAITDEDIFTIAKNEADNLSSFALNTLYGSYLCTLTNSTVNAYSETDIRKGVIDVAGMTTLKYAGLPTSEATSNIPIFRKSEMSLIIAEVAARANNIAEARNYLLYTAKRNTAITSVDDLPGTTDELLTFISEERVREFAGEGHRLYDARRMGDKVKMSGFNDLFDIAKFVLPIPASETNAGFMTQPNENWDAAIPQQ
jgi:hypothetical protein